MDYRKIAKGLGWFSIGLGLAEVFAPRQLNRMLGVREHNKLVRSFGLREIGAGTGILARDRKLAPWLWARVAGDALDLGALAVATRDSRKRGMLAFAIANVAAITALDVWTGLRLQNP